MSDDEGEKFYLDYWTFGPMSSNDVLEDHSGEKRNHDEEGRATRGLNCTIIERAMPPFLLHSASNSVIAGNMLSRYIRFPISQRSSFHRRDFQCPSGTSNCASINRPSSCCAEGQTCQLIQDTGLGDVGCCAAGETCGGSLSECAADYTDCPNYPGGGCCIPGYACVSGGCLLSSTATVVVTPSTSSTQSSSLTTQSPSSSTVIRSSSPTSSDVIPPPTSSQRPLPSTTQSLSETSTTTTTSTAPNTIVCSSGFRSCPASLGGGCCPTDRACGRDVCPELSSTATVGAPVRPTSDVPTTAAGASITGCPTGFYACSAFYQGGCCRFGRDCAPTSCPTNPTTTLIDANSVTIIATISSGLSANTILTGACATGWSTCAASNGGGCCPTGYACGSSCTATATASGLQASQVGKLAPNEAVRGAGKGRGLLGTGTVLMVLIFLAV